VRRVRQVSVGIATAIADKYPTFRSLMSAYQNDSLKEQDKVLSTCWTGVFHHL
jgi:hypothetical protein